MEKPYLIGIAGESGVGKSTIAEIISLYFGQNKTTIISTDDLHKWERNNINWKEMTHLNPDANNLELGDLHLQDLASGKFIYRSIYNHKTGYFDPPIKIEPKENIIIEGLHSFYTDISKSLVNIKIFVDTDEDLRIHWKIIRDTEERGYTYNTALEAINKRQEDAKKIREKQLAIADVIIRLVPNQKINRIGDKHEEINLVTKITYQHQIDHSLFIFIENYVTEFNKFVLLSENLGNNIEMCQNGGGNVSVKISDQCLLIKASGYSLKDVYQLNGFSLLNHQAFKDISSEEEYNQKLQNSTKYKRPSMETGFHTYLKKYVVHVHPIYLTLLLSLTDSKDIIEKIFNKFNYQYIEYVGPGFGLYKKIEDRDKEVYFLENHGIIISSDDYAFINTSLNEIHHISKLYVNYVFNLDFADKEIEDKFTFPDAVIFAHDKSKREIQAAHNYINEIGNKMGTLRYLNKDELFYLKNLEAEKYRKTI